MVLLFNKTISFAEVRADYPQKAGSLKMNTALEHSTRVVQEGGRRCKKSTLNDLVHLTPLKINLMNPPREGFAGSPAAQLLLYPSDELFVRGRPK
jgi:hypothetical protein